MNWRKGLWRLWCALSLCWVISIAAIAWNTEQGRAKRLQAANSCVEQEKEKLGRDPDPSVCMERAGITVKDIELDLERRAIPEFFGTPATVTGTVKNYVKDYGALMLVAPLVTLGLGLLGAWVASGFARRGT
jgi:hypothetical protein